MKYSWYHNKRIRILAHILAWIIVFSLPYLVSTHYSDDRSRDPDYTGFVWLGLLTGILWVGLFYLNAYLLTPRFFNRGRFGLFAATLPGVFCVIMALHSFLFVTLIKHKAFSLFNSVVFNLPAFVLTVAVSTTYYMISDKIRTDRLAQEKQEENLKTELSFLRSQISPHFMFNVLNNMLALSRIKSAELEPTIFKLSSLMRYMLYEADEDRVPLKKEVECLQSYIDLQRQRLSSKVKLNVMMSAAEQDYEIVPMILIPFIENAFKHGTGNMQQQQIDIDLYTKNDILYFKVENCYNSSAEEIKDKTSGIGLANVKRRLNLLYGKNYELNITQKDNRFHVYLQLNLQK